MPRVAGVGTHVGSTGCLHEANRKSSDDEAKMWAELRMGETVGNPGKVARGVFPSRTGGGS